VIKLFIRHSADKQHLTHYITVYSPALPDIERFLAWFVKIAIIVYSDLEVDVFALVEMFQ